MTGTKDPKIPEDTWEQRDRGGPVRTNITKLGMKSSGVLPSQPYQPHSLLCTGKCHSMGRWLTLEASVWCLAVTIKCCLWEGFPAFCVILGEDHPSLDSKLHTACLHETGSLGPLQTIKVSQVTASKRVFVIIKLPQCPTLHSDWKMSWSSWHNTLLLKNTLIQSSGSQAGVILVTSVDILGFHNRGSILLGLIGRGQGCC